MKTKNISILLFVLIVAGFFLLSATPARADWDRGCHITGMNTGECLVAGPWTLKAFFGFDDLGREIPVVLGVNWPICDTANNRKIFRYITGPTVLKDRISAQSYQVFNWPIIPSLGGVPGGAQLNLDQLYSDCGDTVPVEVAWKLNQTVTKTKDGIIDIYMPVETDVNPDGYAWIKWSDTCEGGQIWVAEAPGAGTGIPLQTTRTFSNCGPGNSVSVEFNACGFVETVTCATGTAGYRPDAQLCFDTDGTPGIDTDTDDCVPDPNLGPRAGGAVVCTNPPVFVYGEAMWFCPYPPSP